MLRYLHANGASLFFIAVYAHIFSLYYGSYKEPRESLGYRNANLCSYDGNSIYGLCITLGTNVILKCNSHNWTIWSGTIYWRCASNAITRWSSGR